MLRFIIFILLLIPATLYHSLRMVVAALLPGDAGRKGERIGHRWGKAMIRLSAVPLEVDLSALKPDGHYVFMVNHQSNFDILVLYTVLKGYPVRFVAKKSLFDIPIFGLAMRRAGHIPIDRENRRSGMKSLQEAADMARAGVCPIIFPEGTRNPDTTCLMDFKIGGMVLALKCGLPVAPIVMAGTGTVLPRKGLLMRKAPIRVKALPPIEPGAYTMKEREKFRDDLHRIMDQAYKELNKEG